MLDSQQHSREIREARLAGLEIGHRGADRAQKRVEFVHGAISLDARSVLRNALSSGKTGFPPVALARIDAIDGQPGSVEGLFANGLLTPRKTPLEAGDEIQPRGRE